MATETTNYQFMKPEETDYYDIQVYGDFLDRVDEELFKGQGGQILWRGALLQGGSVQFTVPRECFHNQERTLTLILDGYYDQRMDIAQEGGNIGITGVTFCFGSTSDFGIAYPSGGVAYGPYQDSDNNVVAHIYRVDSVHERIAALNAMVKVRKVPDTRYAVCTIDILSYVNGSETIVGVYAIVPRELEVQV